MLCLLKDRNNTATVTSKPTSNFLQARCPSCPDTDQLFKLAQRDLYYRGEMKVIERVIGDEVSLEKVDKFCYLGDILDADGGCDSAVPESDLLGKSFVNSHPF